MDALMATGMKLASAEKEANVAEATMLGAAFADGFLAKMAAAEQGAVQTQANIPVAAPTHDSLKQAAVQGFDMAASNSVEKVAAELARMPEDQLRKVAAEAGYQDVMAKVAAEYQVGHDAAMQEVGNGAYNEFIKGAAEADEMLRRYVPAPS